MNLRILLCITMLTIISVNAILAQGSCVQSDELYFGKAEVRSNECILLKPGFNSKIGSDVLVHIVSEPITSIDYDPIIGSEVHNANVANINHVLTTTLAEPTWDVENVYNKKNHQEIDYFDHFGKQFQKVYVSNEPSKDLIFHQTYDEMNRTSKKYLPFASTNENHFYSTAESECVDFYSNGFEGKINDTKPYCQYVYDKTPLNNLIEYYNEGENWQDNPVLSKIEFDHSPIRHWKVDNYYPPVFSSFIIQRNNLKINVMIDENGNIQKSYYNVLNQNILTEKYNQSNIYRTHYIYDDFDRLRCVITPKAVENGGPTAVEFCFFYNYDEKGRLIEKKIPGVDWIYIIYDKLDRPVMVQDGEMRLKNQWRFNLYDLLDRKVAEGTIITSINQSTIRDEYNNFTGKLSESFSVNYIPLGYNMESVPGIFGISPSNCHSVFWYDNYQFKELLNDSYNFPEIPNGSSNTSNYNNQVKGLLTGSLNTVCNPNLKNLVSINYYDDRHNIKCIIKDNHLNGRNYELFKYNFNDKVIEYVRAHNSIHQDEIVMIKKYEYDNAGRLLKETLNFNQDNEIITRATRYNDIGEPINTYLHGNINGENYNVNNYQQYNIRGWLSKINDVNNLESKIFAMEVKYENPIAVPSIQVPPQYNNNISQILTHAKFDKVRGMGFQYDKTGRLVNAKYAEEANLLSNIGYFASHYDYDANGNLTNLKRAKSNEIIDNLSYNFYNNTNQIASIEDLSHNTEGYNTLGGTYKYNKNGSIVYDPSKNLEIKYNIDNLPSRFEFGPLDIITYVYSSNKEKLSKTTASYKSSNISKVDYCYNFIYVDNSLEQIITDFGRIVRIDEAWRFEYNITDQLGSVNVVFSPHKCGQPEISQTGIYYPYGMLLEQNNYSKHKINKFLYNGKELQDDIMAGLNLDIYDYGARMYDPAVGRWWSVDPLAEKYRRWSPYNYCVGNPIRFIDPDGMRITDPPGSLPSQWMKRITQAAEHAQKSTEAGQNAGSASVSIQGSYGTFAGGVKLGAVGNTKVEAKVEGGFVRTSGSVGTDGITGKANAGYLEGEVSVGSANNTASALVEIGVAKGAVNANLNDGVTTSGNLGYANAEVKIGNNKRNVNINESGEIGLSAKFSIFSASVSVNIKNAVTAVSECIQAFETIGVFDSLRPQIPEELKL